MKFFAVIALAIFFICAAQAQRGGYRGQDQYQGGHQAECPSVCPLNFLPTCGFNGRCYKQFSNACALNVANCNGQGNFRQVDIQECSKRDARLC